jgi:hypothetical protein
LTFAGGTNFLAEIEMGIMEALAAVEIHVTSLENEVRENAKAFYRGDGPARVDALRERLAYQTQRLHKIHRT